MGNKKDQNETEKDQHTRFLLLSSWSQSAKTYDLLKHLLSHLLHVTSTTIAVRKDIQYCFYIFPCKEKSGMLIFFCFILIFFVSHKRIMINVLSLMRAIKKVWKTANTSCGKCWFFPGHSKKIAHKSSTVL